MEKGQKAQSGIIVIVILVLLALVAIIILYSIILPMLQGNSKNIGTQQQRLALPSLNPNKVDIGTGFVNVTLQASPGDGHVTKVKLTFLTNNGSCDIEQAVDIWPLETKTYSVNITSCKGNVTKLLDTYIETFDVNATTKAPGGSSGGGGGGGPGPGPGCTQTTTCASLGKQCGTWIDNCGDPLDCNSCGTGFSCNATGQCNWITGASCFNIADDPVKLCVCGDIQSISQKLGGNFEVLNNIDCSITKTWNTGKGFKPIGTLSNPFTGNLDGKNHTISNLYINGSDDYVGLFGVSNGGIISNIGLININISGNSSVGALLGKGTSVTITKSYSTGKINADAFTGGLAGTIEGMISNTYSSVDIKGGDFLGGLAGSTRGTMTDSYASGSLVGEYNLGGLVAYGDMLTIKNSYSAASISSSPNVMGGLVGINGATFSNSYYYYENWCTGHGESSLGCAKSPSITNFYNTGFSVYTSSPAWDFTNVWQSNSGLPTLRGFS